MTTTLKLPKPYPKQLEFIRANERYVGYGGARGGGKTHATRVKAMLLCLKYPGIKILIIRRTFPELLENHIRPFLLVLNGIARYNDKDKRFAFPNGSSIKFGYCATDGDLGQYQGLEYDEIFIDEATQITEYQFNFINSTCRGVNDFPKQTHLCCNPGGVGHGWVKRLFVDREYTPEEMDGRTYDETVKRYRFIRATVRDNPALMASGEYMQTLKSLPENLRRAWLEGDWDALAGQYFDEFRRDIHVCEPFEIPSWWRRYRAFDYGLDMFAVLWAAISDTGQMYIYRELKAPNLIVSAAAARAREMTGDESIHCTFAPPDIKGRQKDTGESMADMFRHNGIPLTHSSADRVAGWMRIKELLKPVQSPDGEGQTAKLQIFSTCTGLIHDLPLLMHDVHKPTDCATEPHEITHICDALRYLCVGNMTPSAEKVELTPEQEWKRKVIRDSARAARNKRW